MKESFAAWRDKNPEYERERSKRRYATDPLYRKRVRANARRFAKEHPEYFRNAAKLRRARLAGVECSLTEQQEIELFEEYSGLCVYCLETATTLEHVVPISAGGAHSKENCAPACKRCNSSKGAKPLLVFLAERRAA